jgi:molybdopterin synthase sulfur carrier subunit
VGTLFYSADVGRDMHWRLFATLAETAGTGEVAVDVEGEQTLREAFDALLAQHPDLESDLLEDGALAGHVRLLVDGGDPFREGEGWETTVDAGTELALFPPVSGG